MFTQDWMMRQIETTTLAIAKIIFQKDTTEYRISHEGIESSAITESDGLYVSLLALTDEGRFDEAENRLFEDLDPTDATYLDVANDFYFRLNLLSDKALSAGNFSRQEIADGLEDVLDRFGVVLP